MKKVVETFVCDRCEKPLPEEYIRTNQLGVSYYDLNNFNTIKFGDGSRVAISMEIDASEFGPTFKELCNECRIHYLEMMLERMKVLEGGESDGKA